MPTVRSGPERTVFRGPFRSPVSNGLVLNGLVLTKAIYSRPDRFRTRPFRFFLGTVFETGPFQGLNGFA